MNRIYLIIALVLATIASGFVGSASAQNRSGSDQQNLGNEWAGVFQTTSAVGQVGTITARTDVSGVTTGKLLRASREASRRTFTANQSGSANRAVIRLVGSTVSDQALPNGQVRSLPSVYRTVFNLQYNVLDIGIAGIGVHASAGAGTQYTAVARNRSGSNPAAHLSGPFQSWIAGEGGVHVQLLWGALGTARATVRLEGLNTTAYMTLATERNSILGSGYSMPVDTLAWRFQVKGRLEGPFGINLGSRTFVDVLGPRRVVDIMH